MAWTTTARVDNVLGSTTLRQRLFAVDGVFSQSKFDQYEQEARGRVVQRLMWAGYSDPGSALVADSTTEGVLAAYVEAIMIHAAFAQGPGIQWPAGLQTRIENLVTEALTLHETKLAVPGLTASNVTGYGGASFTSTTEGVDGSRPQRFSRSELKTM